jgi:hypothetical protein
MRRYIFPLVIALFAFFLGITVTAVWLIKRKPVAKSPQPHLTAEGEPEQTSLNPPHQWEYAFFPKIDERARIADLTNLRTSDIKPEDVEVRVWLCASFTGIEGFLLRKEKGQWVALLLDPIDTRHTASKQPIVLDAPKSGWEACWQRLTDAGILTLPDAYAVQCNSMIEDGSSYVVESRVNESYRTYMYDNPGYAKCEEARQMMRIGSIISEEFGLKEFKYRK